VRELWARTLKYAYGDIKPKIAPSIAKEETEDAESSFVATEASSSFVDAEAAADDTVDGDAMDVEDDSESVMSNFSTEKAVKKAAKKKEREDANILAAAKAFEEGTAGDSYEAIVIKDMRAGVIAIREQASDVGGRIVDANNYRHNGDGSTTIKTDDYNGVVGLITNIYNDFDDEGNEPACGMCQRLCVDIQPSSLTSCSCASSAGAVVFTRQCGCYGGLGGSLAVSGGSLAVSGGEPEPPLLYYSRGRRGRRACDRALFIAPVARAPCAHLLRCEAWAVVPDLVVRVRIRVLRDMTVTAR
jgi:hypothetical protein